MGKDASEIFCCMYQSNIWAGFEFHVYYDLDSCVMKHHVPQAATYIVRVKLQLQFGI